MSNQISLSLTFDSVESLLSFFQRPATGIAKDAEDPKPAAKGRKTTAEAGSSSAPPASSPAGAEKASAAPDTGADEKPAAKKPKVTFPELFAALKAYAVKVDRAPFAAFVAGYGVMKVTELEKMPEKWDEIMAEVTAE